MRINRKLCNFLKWSFVLFWIFFLFIASIAVYWFYRPNTSYINPNLDMTVEQAFEEDWHNSNTNLEYWKGNFYLVHQSSINHWAALVSKIVVRKSAIGENYDTIVVELNSPGEDIRDPKFGNFNDTLFIYALPNHVNLIPINSPYKTVYSKTTDGVTWTEFKDIEGDAADGWNLWRPKTLDNITWYVTAHKTGHVALFSSTNGVKWDKVSDISTGNLCSESAMDFTSNGDIIATSRCEASIFGGFIGDFNGHTLISIASAPYTSWTKTESYVTKLDGPAVFLNPVDNKTYAVGRYEPEAKGLFTAMGSFFCKKRTSIFLLEPNKLIYLSDFPSGGDTSYLGAIVKDGRVYLSYYTSDITRDFIWLEGQMMPSSVMIANVSLTSLAAVAANPPIVPLEGFPNVFLMSFIAGLVILVVVERKKRRK